MAHLLLQKADLKNAVDAFDSAISLLRVKQELEETCAMREATAAQLTLISEQNEIYAPILERHRAAQAAQMGM